MAPVSPSCSASVKLLEPRCAPNSVHRFPTLDLLQMMCFAFGRHSSEPARFRRTAQPSLDVLPKQEAEFLASRSVSRFDRILPQNSVPPVVV
jgi:hypothetical protein